MAGIKMQFNGLKKFDNFIINLPKKLDRELSKNNQEFMESVENDAKEFAPKDTHELEESIKLEPVRKGENVKRWKIVVHAPYGTHQEEGFTPHFAYITKSNKFKVPSRRWVSKWTPFMKPAFEKNIAKYLNMLTISTKRALAK